MQRIGDYNASTYHENKVDIITKSTNVVSQVNLVLWTRRKAWNNTNISVKDAFKIIDKIQYNGIKYVLFENDLPDIFNEN